MMLRGSFLLLIAVIASFSVHMPLSVPTAFAQARQTDQQLMARLDELARRKGIPNKSLTLKVCEMLGLNPIGNCEMYHAAFADKNERYGHAFNTYDEPGTGQKRFVIFIAAPEDGEVYLVDRDAKLLKAVRRKGAGENAVWSVLSIDQAKANFQKELEYWRKNQDALANRPN